jgi:proteasome accessory factor C
MSDPQPLQAQDKLTFLLALVPYLIDRERVSVAEAARHFGVPPARIRRAVELIAISGVPGETMQYQHGDLFDIAWDDLEQNDMIVLTNLVAIDDSPRLSAREASALIAGLQYLSALPEAADTEVIRALMSKLSRGAGGSAGNVAVGRDGHDATLGVVRRALTTGHGLSFDYAGPRTQGGIRHVDPLRIESIDTDWYLRAWDLDRGALRTFRLDRMSQVGVEERLAEHAPDGVQIPDTLFQRSADDIIVTVELDSSSLPLVADYLADTADAPDSIGRVRIRLATSSGFDGVTRLVAGLPGRAVVLDPPAARRAVREFAEQALAAADAARGLPSASGASDVPGASSSSGE